MDTIDALHGEHARQVRRENAADIPARHRVYRVTDVPAGWAWYTTLPDFLRANRDGLSPDERCRIAILAVGEVAIRLGGGAFGVHAIERVR
jgi:hypothetical protein